MYLPENCCIQSKWHISEELLHDADTPYAGSLPKQLLLIPLPVASVLAMPVLAYSFRSAEAPQLQRFTSVKSRLWNLAVKPCWLSGYFVPSFFSCSRACSSSLYLLPSPCCNPYSTLYSATRIPHYPPHPPPHRFPSAIQSRLLPRAAVTQSNRRANFVNTCFCIVT